MQYNDILPELLPVFSLKETTAEADWEQAIKAKINHLITEDFAGLIYILYRVDVSEHKIEALLKKMPEQYAATIIFDLIAERMLEKKKNREAHRNVADDEDGEGERW